MNPLSVLPPELTLRILSSLAASDIAALQTSSQQWNDFISVHEDPVYRTVAGYLPPVTLSEVCGLKAANTAELDYWSNITTWKQYCAKYSPLYRNLVSPKPLVKERVVRSHGSHLVWRFRPDFERRWVISTAHQGQLQVRDLDTSLFLWGLSESRVRSHAHLEYSQGFLVFDAEDTLSVWRVTGPDDGEDHRRGWFINIAELDCDQAMRGFQLDFPTLCVVSSEGTLNIWDLSTINHSPEAPAHLSEPTRVIRIQPGAIGHLDQTPSAVLYSLGQDGLILHNKHSGALLGRFPPPNLPRKNIFHVKHPPQSPHLSRVLEKDHSDDIAIAKLNAGPRQVLLDDDGGPFLPIEEEEWGAGNIDGPYLVGISKGGRVMVCSDWEGVLRDPKRSEDCLAIIEMDPEAGVNFELGGWLHVKFGRVIFEVTDRIYMMHLPEKGCLPSVNRDQLPIHAIPSSSSFQLPVAVSFMCLTEDGFMATYSNISMKREFSTGRAMPRLDVKKQARVVSYILPNNQH